MRKNVIYLMGCAAVMILAASCAGRSKDSTAQKTVPEFVLTYAEECRRGLSHHPGSL